MIAPDDRGFTLGDGLFETILVESGQPRKLAEHLARLEAGCAVIGLPAPDAAAAERSLHAAVAAAGLSLSRAAVRLNWTAGSGGRGLDRPQPPAPALTAIAAPAPPPAGPARVILAATARNDRSPASRVKSLSYLDNVLARAEARAAGADEALMLNTRGEFACATAANFFWEADGRLFTPALDCGVLAGTMRAEVIAAAARLGIPLAEVRAGPEVLEATTGAFLTNSLIGLRPISNLAGRAIASPAIMERLVFPLDEA